MDPVDTSAQVPLHPVGPHQTTKEEESADTTFMVVRHVNQFILCLGSWKALESWQFCISVDRTIPS
jgi:hypothetical protein